MCTSAHYLNNIPLVVFTDTLSPITSKLLNETFTYTIFNFDT